MAKFASSVFDKMKPANKKKEDEEKKKASQKPASSSKSSSSKSSSGQSSIAKAATAGASAGTSSGTFASKYSSLVGNAKDVFGSAKNAGKASAAKAPSTSKTASSFVSKVSKKTSSNKKPTPSIIAKTGKDDSLFTEKYFTTPEMKKATNVTFAQSNAREKAGFLDASRRLQAGINYYNTDQNANRAFQTHDDLFNANDLSNKQLRKKWMDAMLKQASEEDVRWIIADMQDKAKDFNGNFKKYTQEDLDYIMEYAKKNYTGFANDELNRIGTELSDLDAGYNNRQQTSTEVIDAANEVIYAANMGNSVAMYVANRPDLRQALGYDELAAQYSDMDLDAELWFRANDIAAGGKTAANEDALYQQYADKRLGLQSEYDAQKAIYEGLLTRDEYNRLMADPRMVEAAEMFDPQDYRWSEAYDVPINSNGDMETRYRYNVPTLPQIMEDRNGVNEAYQQAIGAGAAPGMSETIGLVNQMTEEEQQLYKAIYYTQGEEAAQKYFDFIKDDLFARETEGYVAATKDLAQDKPLIASAASIATQFLGTLAGTADALAGRAGGSQFADITNTARETVGQNIAEAAPWANVHGVNIMQALYNVGMSGADMLANRGLAAIVGGGQMTGEALLALGAFAQTYSDVYERTGGDVGTAWLEALGAAGIEAATEHISWGALENIGDISMPVERLKYLLKAGTTEGFEEGLSSVGNDALQLALEGEDSEIMQRYNYYAANGYTPKEAGLRMLDEQVTGLVTDIAGGFVLGEALAGPNLAVQAAGMNAENKRIGGQLMEYGDADEQIYQGLLDLAGTVELSKQGKKVYEALKSQYARDESFDGKNANAQANAQQQRDSDIAAALNNEDARSELTDNKNAEAQAYAAWLKQNGITDALDNDIAASELIEGKNAAAQANAQQRKDAAVADDLSSENARDELVAGKNAQAQDAAAQRKNAAVSKSLDGSEARSELTEGKNAQAQSNAQAKKAADVAADLSTDAGRKALAPGKKKGAVNRAKIGRLYREVMQKLDSKAQDALRERMSYDVVKALEQAGVKAANLRGMAESILRIQDNTATQEDFEVVRSNEPVRMVLMEYTAKINAADEAVEKTNDLAGLLRGNPIKAREISEPAMNEPKKLEIKDEFDQVAADVQAREESTLVNEGESSTLDGEDIEIVGVEAAEGSTTDDVPKLVIKTKAGETRTVEADSIAYGANDSSTYKLAVYSEEYGRQGDLMFSAYKAGQNVDEYARAFHTAAQYGSDGRNLDNLKNSGAVSVLNDNQIGIAYNIGKALRTARTQAQQMMRSVKGAMVAVGNVDTGAIRKASLTQHQKNSIAAMGKLAKVLGINVKFVQSRANADGSIVEDNGSWNADTRTLTLDINAGKLRAGSARNLVMDTAGHELTHYIKQFANADLWNDYQDFIMNHLDTKLDLEHEIERYLAADKNLDRDGAIEEIIAQASTQALSKITDEQIADLANTNKTLFEKIKAFIAKWAKNLQKAIKDAFSTGTGASNYIAQAMEAQLDEVAKRWNTMLAAASRTANETQGANPGYEVSEAGKVATIQNSRRSLEVSEYAKDPDKMAASLAKAVNVPVSQAKRYIKNMFSIAKIIAGDQTRLDYEGNPLNSVLKDNAEYKFTVDMSTLCAKRLIYTGTLDAIQNEMPNTVLTSEDLCDLRSLMMDRDYEVACGICYVESRRRELGSITKGFVDAYNDALAKGEDVILGPKNNKEAFKTEGTNMLTLADVNTTAGIENIQRNHPEIYRAYLKYMNARGVSKPKLIETRTDYRNEILDLFNSKRSVRDRNENGGLRIQSFSDFEVVHLIDMMQVITDMAQVGLAGQAYTKVPNFAEAMGRTGLKINLSLIAKGDGVDADGNLIFDDIEGMPAEDAFRLRKKYSKNVGTILVGKSDEHIRAALNDPRIDFVIPFHKSGWSESLYAKLGLTNYSDYTNFQNERAVTDSSFKWDHSKSASENQAAINKIRDKGRHIDNFLPMEYWDFSLSGEENAQNYLEACYYDGRIPKFPQFVNEPGYWKLLIDFKMYDNNGVGSPQLPVKPDFNMTQARRMLKEYNGSHTSLPVAHDIVVDFVNQYKKKADVKRSDRTIDAEYQEAYESGDEYRAREMVRDAAIAAGYNPLRLYHGTNAFGFTKIDPSKSDDGISFFTSTDDMVAKTYAGNDAKIRRVSATGGITFDQLMNADGKTILDLLHKNYDEPYELASPDEVRELVSDEGELIRKRIIPEAERRIAGLREQAEDWPTDPEKDKAVIKTYEALVEALDRLSYAKNYDLLESLYRAYDDALWMLRSVDESEASLYSYEFGNDVHARYYQMRTYLSGDLFKVEDEWSTEYITRTQAIDMLYPKLFKGIYELYGKTDNLLEINGHGANWNRLDGGFLLGKTYATTRDFAEYAKEMGFDGVHFKNIHDVGGMANYNAASDIYTFFNPGDLKSADPFTFDDNGDLIPLSERFKRDDADIRYSIRETTDSEERKAQMRDPYNASDRELLADALESLAANADELNILRIYQGRVQSIEAKQQQLDAVEEQLAALKQEDPKANREEIIKLTNNARTIGNQISRMDKELLRLEVMDSIKKLAERERANYTQKLKDKTDAQIRRYKERVKASAQRKIDAVREREAEKRRVLREQGETRLRKAVEEQREIGQRKVDRLKESEKKNHYKTRLLKDIATMREWLTKPTNKGHVPQYLRAPLADFLESLDYSSDRSLKGGNATQADAKMLEKMDALRRALGNTRQNQSDFESGEAAFKGYMDLPDGFAEMFDDLSVRIKNTLARSSGDVPINRMTGDQLKELSDMVRTINTAVRQMNRLLANAKYQQVSEAAHNTMTTLGKLGEKFKQSALVGKISSFLDWTNTTPFYAFRRFGEGGKAIFEGLMNGWDKLAFNSKELIDYANSAYTTKQVREWSQQMHTIDLNGSRVQMTTAQIMSLYCLNKRAQARGHLLGGGIRIADIRNKGKVITQANNHTLTEADISSIIGLLTNEQIEVAKKLQHFMNTRCTEWGNEVSMTRFGYEAFGDEDFYFPIESDKNNLKGVDPEAQENSMFRLLNLSATKSTVKNANNALVIRDIFDVFSAHGSDMAKYNALALPILDAVKWYNFVEKTNNEDGTIETDSIQKALEKAYGKDAQMYIRDFLKDLNGVREGGRHDGLVSKMISNYKVAAVAANLRVGMLQITSMPRAAYAIDPKYLAAGTAKNVLAKNNKIAREKIGIGLWKSLGFYDTNISRGIRELVKHDQTIGDTIKDKSMILAEKGDAWTMGVLYGAVEAEMADKHPNITKGSAAYDRMVNERVREIVYQTQVVDSTMTRSDIMRDTGGLSTLTTAFMSEPTLTMNMLADSIFEQRMKARETGKKMIAPSRKMVKAFAVNALVLTFSAVMEAAFTAWRDDDEYETLAEKFDEAFLDTLLENMNLLNNIPFVKDIVSAIQGNSADRMDSAWAYNLWQGVEEIYKYLTGKSTNPAYNGIYKTLNGLSQMSGYAVGGLARELVSAYNNVIAARMGYTKIQTYADSTSDAAKAILNAYAAGDDAMAARYLDIAAKHGIEGEKLENAMKNATGDAYIEGTIDAETAKQAMETYGGKSSAEADEQLMKWEYEAETGHKYSSMKDDYIAGSVDRAKVLEYYDEDKISQWDYEKETGSAYSDMREEYLAGRMNASQAMQSMMAYGGKTQEKAEEQIDRWDYYQVTGDSDGYTKYWRMYYAFDNGGDFRKYAKQWIDAGVKKSYIASSIAGRYKEEYLAIKGTPAGDRMLEHLLDLYEAIGYNRAYERKYINTKWTSD